MSIISYIAKITDSKELLKKLLVDEFELSESEADSLAKDKVIQHLNKLKDSCYILAETSYVDKVYRDSFYYYYSSKLKKYKRDCVRLAFFDGEISEEDFRDIDKAKRLQEIFLGFIVLRPTVPSIIGRSVISPKALKENNFSSCWVSVQTTINSVKLELIGFPHSSQDTETITCAETTLWAVMEYFGNKYPDYKPVLPSKIIHTLNSTFSERQIPSKGLNISQMSYALKEFGFGSRIYSKAHYGDEFERLLSCYVESGIPVIIGLDNRPVGNIGHAVLCIGHEKISNDLIDTLPSNKFESQLKSRADLKSIEIQDWHNIEKKFIFIDDNFPIYQKAFLNTPALHYPSHWHDCKIKHFIIPLYPKIYLEAFEAKSYVLRFLIMGARPLTDNSSVLIRFFLTSSRSFKDSLALNSSFDSDVKALILETSMPKFIWVAELSSKDLMKQKKANGLMILDATEADTRQNKPLIFAAFQGKINKFASDHGELEDFALDLPEYLIYENNLRSF